MSIGGTLAGARQAAGLTVSEVSARTRIRGGLIRAIEHDDFGVCGGDFYARGHIRAIARVVGVDSGPLIAEYDAVLPMAPPPPSLDDTVEDLFMPPDVRQEPPPPAGSPAPLAHGHRAGVHPAHGQPAHAQPAHAQPAHGQSAHGRQGRGHRAPAHRTRGSRDRGRRLLWLPAPLALLAVVALAVIGGGAYQLAAGTGSPRTGTAAARTSSPPRSPSAARSAPPTTAPSGTAPTVPSSSPSAQAQQMKPSHVTAYGPGGTSDGDNASSASQALSGDPHSPWLSEWYTSASFGNLKHGTGLLFTLPHAVSASAVTIWLGFPGATVQVRAGTSRGSLHTVASASHAGRTVRLPLASRPLVRYVVVWFTRLPPDGNGTYQAAVYGLTVTAAPASPAT